MLDSLYFNSNGCAILSSAVVHSNGLRRMVSSLLVAKTIHKLHLDWSMAGVLLHCVISVAIGHQCVVSLSAADWRRVCGDSQQ